MRVVFAGTPEVALPALAAVAGSAHDLVGVVTRPDAPTGRGRRLTPLSGRRGRRRPRRPGPEAGAPAGAGVPDRPARAGARRLPRRGLRRPAPRVGARHPPARLGQPALLAAARLAGGGPGAARDLGRRRRHRRHHLPDRQGARRRPDVRADDRDRSAPTTRPATCSPGSPRAAPGSWSPRSTASPTAPSRRDRSRGTTCPSRPRSPSTTPASTGRSRPPLIDRQVRACTPAPGAWTTYAGERLKLGPMTPADGSLPPGELDGRQERVVVGTGAGALRLGDVQAVGKRPMPAADWARGLRLTGGEVLT